MVHQRLYEQTPAPWIDTAQKYVDKGTLKSWQETRFNSNQNYQQVLQLLGEHYAEGRKLLAGTDVLNPYVIAGFSLHEELQQMVKAGLSPYLALKTATVNAGHFLDEPMGTIAPGQKANLLLLTENPLNDIANTQSINIWFSN